METESSCETSVIN